MLANYRLCPSRNLNDYTLRLPGKKPGPRDLAELLEVLIQTVAHIHSLRIAHCDLKFENILFDQNSRNLKIIDFGFSVKDPDLNVQDFVCGTPTYMCPLAVKKLEHDKFKADVWALGVIGYKLATGMFPFRATKESELHQKILRGEYSFPASLSVNFGVKELIGSMLEVKESQRADLATIIE